MSYALIVKCGTCEKYKNCSDYHIFRGAIDTIHMIGSEKGHLGSGNVTVNCQNHMTKKENT